MDQPSADFARQRHLLQLQYTDVLLGRLIDRMKQLGTWDDSLFVVTADHGASFVGGEPSRGLSQVNHPDILWTPLFVKAPGQRQAAVSDGAMRTIDIVPTMADHLGVDLPWDLDGRSALDTGSAADDERRALRWKFNTLEPRDGDYLVFDGRAGFEAVLRKSPELGAGEGVERLFRVGRYGHLVGTRLDELAVAGSSPVTGRLENPEGFEDVDPDASELPTYVAGEIESDEVVSLVVSVNGVVGGWSDTTVNKYPDREAAAEFGVDLPAGAERVRRFSTLVPEELLRRGDNDVEVFVVEGAGDAVTLAPVPLDR